jgi:hypothetical protein
MGGEGGSCIGARLHRDGFGRIEWLANSIVHVLFEHKQGLPMHRVLSPPRFLSPKAWIPRPWSRDDGGEYR